MDHHGAIPPGFISDKASCNTQIEELHGK